MFSFSEVIGDIVVDTFRKAGRAIIALIIVGVSLLGAGFATGTIHSTDLQPDNLRKVVAACQDRVNMIREFAGELTKVDPAGVIGDLHDRQEYLEELGGTENTYGNGDLGDGEDDSRSEISDGDGLDLSGNL